MRHVQALLQERERIGRRRRDQARHIVNVTSDGRFIKMGAEDERYPVRIVRTPCNLGGSRPWFICPALGCGRRVAILYGGGIFACRHCYQLAYASAREDAGDRATRRADRIRARLGWEPGILNGNGDKPKWMRWRTFYRLRDAHDRLVNRSGPKNLDTPVSVISARRGILKQPLIRISLSRSPAVRQRSNRKPAPRTLASRRQVLGSGGGHRMDET